MVQKSGIQCYNCKEYGHVARECQKSKKAKDAAYHREKMLLYAVDSGPIFDKEPEQKVQNDDHYDVFAIEYQHPEQSKSVYNTYLIEQDAQNVFIESEDMNYDSEQIDQNDEDVDLAKEQANNKLSEVNAQLYADYKKSKAELQRRNTIEYATEMELECAKARGDLLSYKMEYERSSEKYTHLINNLNQTVSELKEKLSAHQDTISILKQQKDA
nr:hypothetical protein [Tanacetum cinerariifolium]